MTRKRYSRQQITRYFFKRCFFCQEDSQALLDCHRIIPGEQGGKYIESNTICLCANCHRRVHAGEIVIDRKYHCTGPSLWVLHCWINGEEQWLRPPL